MERYIAIAIYDTRFIKLFIHLNISKLANDTTVVIVIPILDQMHCTLA